MSTPPTSRDPCSPSAAGASSSEPQRDAPCALTLIRHGETDWNRAHRFQGQLDVPLNALGLQQAERLADRLGGETFDLAITSDLGRVKATAAPLLQRLGLSAQVDPAWREQCFGVFEGLHVSEVKEQHADLWAQWCQHDAEVALPGGESVRQFHTRVWAALNALGERCRGQRVLVVTHGGVLDMVWRTAKGQALSSARTCAIPNAGLNRLRWWGPGQVEIDTWGDDQHLAELPAQPSTVSLSVLYRDGVAVP